MTGATAEKFSKSYMLRGDQVERIERLTRERPGAAFSDIVRDVLDLGFVEYERRQTLMQAFAERGA